VVGVQDPRVEAARLAEALRRREVPVLGRVHEGTLLLDCRTLLADDVDEIPRALAEAFHELRET